jgi:hypothetical protein
MAKSTNSKPYINPSLGAPVGEVGEVGTVVGGGAGTLAGCPSGVTPG